MESTYVTVTVDELIIEFVKENPCIYNKSDANYKNIIIKKRVWQKLSENLKTVYNVDMTADVIEKRWSSLRDMFNREHRKQKMQPSGSGYTPTKEWELYKYMLFLIPHVAHRRTKTSFPLPSQSTIDLTSSALCEATNSCLSSNTLINNSTVFDTYSEDGNLEGEESLQTEKDELEINSIEEDMISRSTSTFSNYSSSSSNTQLSVQNTRNIKSPSLIFKPMRKVTPEPDKFAKRKKNKDDQIDRELAEVSSVISTAMNSVQSLVSDQKDDKEKDGYMIAIGEALKHVPGKNKTQCLIEMLQIIQKFEDRKE